MRRTGTGRFAAWLLVGVLAPFVIAADWPQWRGPDRTGVSHESGLLQSWPAGGPKLVWKARGLGEGYTTPSVAKGRIYGMGLYGGDEAVWALNAQTGDMIWHTRIAGLTQLDGPQGGNGPRSTPTVDGDKIYTLDVGGILFCLNAADGKPIWSRSLVFYGGHVPTWGYSESPLVDGDKVIVTPGGSAASVLAFNKDTGAVVWKARVPDRNDVAYSSVITAEVDGQKEYIAFLAQGLVGVSAKDGRFLWRYDHPACGNGINCATPIYRDNLVFAASSYGNGGGLARLTSSGGGVTAREQYFTSQMKNHHGGVVLVGDYLYGFDENTLTCIEFKTGKIMWTNRSVGKGSVTYADDRLYVRSERGPVALVAASPQGYMEKGRFDQPDRTSNPSWPYPVVSNGRLYLRDQDILLCYEVK